MSNSLFRVMKAATGSALSGLTGVVSGSDAIAGKVAALVSAFQDSSGNATIPQLTSLGAIPVDLGGVCRQSAGPNPLLAGTATLADITAAAITLTATKKSGHLTAMFASAQESEFIIYQQDDATKTELMKVRVGPGNTTVPIDLTCFEVTAGASGTQELRVEAKNCDPDQLAEMNAYMSIREEP